MSTFGSQTGKLAPQATLVQRYTIIRLAGRGGMSAIYQAMDQQQGRMRVAIKEMSLENLDAVERQDALARFQQEAHLLETLNHPNLTRIYDAFSEDGRSFLVMDYIDGKTLLQLLQDAGQPLAVEQVMHYAEQLCDVLTYLHQHNPPIIFRDLKPTNVMATPDGHVYLIDFGIARFFKEGQHQDTTVLGSPGYAPPEQHGSGQTNPRSDLYALGATLHCCLSNHDPYHAADRFTFAPVRQFNPQVPEALDQLILRMVAMDENQRPTSALEVKQALARIRQQLWKQNSTPGTQLPLVSAPSAAPTQYVQPPKQAYQATMPALGQTGPQEKLILRAVPLPANAGQPNAGHPPAHYASLPPAHPQKDMNTRVWTPVFIIVFFLILLVTLGGSALAFNILTPYGPGNHAGLDHMTEAGLVVLALIVSLLNLFAARSAIATLATLGSGVALLVAGSGFLLQTLRDVQNSGQLYAQVPVEALFTTGLLAAGIISLLWLLARRLTWGDRLWLGLFFVATSLCAYLQTSFLDSDQNKHFLLLGVLIIFIQGVLMAGQMGRKRE
jgi:serine/threonine protein kinase